MMNEPNVNGCVDGWEAEAETVGADGAVEAAETAEATGLVGGRPPP